MSTNKLDPFLSERCRVVFTAGANDACPRGAVRMLPFQFQLVVVMAVDYACPCCASTGQYTSHSCPRFFATRSFYPFAALSVSPRSQACGACSSRCDVCLFLGLPVLCQNFVPISSNVSTNTLVCDSRQFTPYLCVLLTFVDWKALCSRTGR